MLFGTKPTVPLAFTLCFRHQSHGEGNSGHLPSPCILCQKHSVKASGRWLRHGLLCKNGEGKLPLPSPGAINCEGERLHLAFAAKTHGEGKRALPSPVFSVLVSTTHSDCRRVLPSPRFWCDKATVKANRLCDWKAPLAFTMFLCCQTHGDAPIWRCLHHRYIVIRMTAKQTYLCRCASC